MLGDKKQLPWLIAGAISLVSVSVASTVVVMSTQRQSAAVVQTQPVPAASASVAEATPASASAPTPTHQRWDPGFVQQARPTPSETVPYSEVATGELAKVTWDQTYRPHCPHCNAVVSVGFSTCSQCGKSFEKAARACPKCKTGQLFCKAKHAAEARDLGYSFPIGSNATVFCEGKGRARGKRCFGCDATGTLVCSSPSPSGPFKTENFGAPAPYGMYRGKLKREWSRLILNRDRMYYRSYECGKCQGIGFDPIKCSDLRRRHNTLLLRLWGRCATGLRPISGMMETIKRAGLGDPKPARSERACFPQSAG